MRAVTARNVLGGELEPCGTDPMTGFYRDGYGLEVVIDAPRMGITWARFPHLFARFYVFQYGVGISAAAALAQALGDALVDAGVEDGDPDPDRSQDREEHRPDHQAPSHRFLLQMGRWRCTTDAAGVM